MYKVVGGIEIDFFGIGVDFVSNVIVVKILYLLWMRYILYEF